MAEQRSTRGSRASVAIDEAGSLTRITLVEEGPRRPLSTLMPALEDLGVVVVEERTTRLSGEVETYEHNFGVSEPAGLPLHLGTATSEVAEILSAVWRGEMLGDSLNRLVLTAGLDRLQLEILRGLRTYWVRTGSSFSSSYITDVLIAHPAVARHLATVFAIRFEPEPGTTDYATALDSLYMAIDSVPSLDHDRILRGLAQLIGAVIRTNAYLPDRTALALKFQGDSLPDIRPPRPFAEVFVVNDDMEGVHLRAGLRARGGIRWSERREDYRDEILSLMQAQVTKNALIVPTGAKGGFVLRRPPSEEEALKSAIRDAYSALVSGVLDLTDNLIEGELIQARGLKIHDGADPYFVVAADRGTATFSDMANEISRRHGFWLDDAFASGGSNGYDHKALGITARGAWCAVDRHLARREARNSGDTITVVGIGDMSGDVFGNGMLASDRIRLVAAFDHRHIFLDPDPDPDVAYRERRRLFSLPQSSWDDYAPGLISEGGAVVSRGLKKVAISDEVRQVLNTEAETVTTAELIRIVLQAPVDLLWNGGVGTYVKAHDETEIEVGDQSNSAVRIHGAEVRARAVVEGGNLGFTQRGRIEYAQNGGLINADFIDNSGGVNCSDREVNIKILLSLAEQRAGLERRDRDGLMEGSSEAVVERVLSDSIRQARALDLEEWESARRTMAYETLLSDLEARKALNRATAQLPTREELVERSKAGGGLTRPELAVVCAHAKNALVAALLNSDLPDDPVTLPLLVDYFPDLIVARCRSLLAEHPLRRELAATLVANNVIDNLGASFVWGLARRTGATMAQVVRAVMVAESTSGEFQHRQAVDQLFGQVEFTTWAGLLTASNRLLASLARWHLLHGGQRLAGDSMTTSSDFTDVEELIATSGSLQWRAERGVAYERLKEAGVPSTVARRSVLASDLRHAPDILEVVALTERSLAEVVRAFHRIGRALRLDALEDMVASVAYLDEWQEWAYQDVETDLGRIRRALVERALLQAPELAGEEAVEEFLIRSQVEVARLVQLIGTVEARPAPRIEGLVVVVRQLMPLAGPDAFRITATSVAPISG